ncbi:hypothetical protein BDF19DRAFT_462854, partial [Syncephalis fuscata]
FSFFFPFIVIIVESVVYLVVRSLTLLRTSVASSVFLIVALSDSKTHTPATHLCVRVCLVKQLFACVYTSVLFCWVSCVANLPFGFVSGLSLFPLD